jgi:hypothetical protein
MVIVLTVGAPLTVLEFVTTLTTLYLRPALVTVEVTPVVAVAVSVVSVNETFRRRSISRWATAIAISRSLAPELLRIEKANNEAEAKAATIMITIAMQVSTIEKPFCPLARIVFRDL